VIELKTKDKLHMGLGSVIERYHGLNRNFT